jgi:hypothetical protein
MDINNISTNDFAGYVYDDESDKFGLRYEQFISPMIKSIQELTKMVLDQGIVINQLKSDINVLKNTLQNIL